MLDRQLIFSNNEIVALGPTWLLGKQGLVRGKEQRSSVKASIAPDGWGSMVIENGKRMRGSCAPPSPRTLCSSSVIVPIRRLWTWISLIASSLLLCHVFP